MFQGMSSCWSNQCWLSNLFSARNWWLSTNDLDGDLKKLAVEFGIWLRRLRRFEKFQIHNRCIIVAFINWCDISDFTILSSILLYLKNISMNWEISYHLSHLSQISLTGIISAAKLKKSTRRESEWIDVHAGLLRTDASEASVRRPKRRGWDAPCMWVRLHS